MTIANLTEKKWLWRSFYIISPAGTFEIIYNGKGMGFEEVLIDGEVAVRLPSYLWYVPRFDFLVGNLEARINVRVWAWLEIRSFELIIDGQTVYSE